MTIPNKIVELAVSGGWKSDVGLDPTEDERVAFEIIVLDPLFWSSLGKQLGWETDMEYFKCSNDECAGSGDWMTKKFCPDCGGPLEPFTKHSKEWLKQWHSFIDYIAEGKDTDAFWEGLTDKK